MAYVLVRCEENKDCEPLVVGCRLEQMLKPKHVTALFAYQAEPMLEPRKLAEQAVRELASVPDAVVEEYNIAGAGADVQGSAR